MWLTLVTSSKQIPHEISGSHGSEFEDVFWDVAPDYTVQHPRRPSSS
jgi:hypothetical protein